MKPVSALIERCIASKITFYGGRTQNKGHAPGSAAILTHCHSQYFPSSTNVVMLLWMCKRALSKDLQKLWEDSRSVETATNSSTEKDNSMKSGQTTVSKEQVRLVTNNGLTIVETGEGGKTEWKEIVAPMNSGKATFERLEAMIAELQEMLRQVKQNVMERASERSDVSLQGEAGAPSMDPAADELEKKAIDDVIARMRGSFLRVTQGSKPVNEVDSSVSASVVDVQSPLKYTPPHLRVARASNDDGDSGNCNDPKLKKLIVKNIGKDAQKSKRAIQKAAEAEFGGTFDVICSPCEFSFVISSQKYCDGFKDQVACFVFLQPPTTLSTSQ
ncbi:ground-like domain protein [Ancylostoma ceylanicum]|uniref:Ground-like domain protein n=1 Tax=Ancylostoma ceylanicum TaxID=53326 RepID=A0A0D6M240_9BILA|nr:ground-like domain protein [Ancylostoma ceylanicum]